MEALAVLRLSASPKRRSSGHGYLADDDEYAQSTPYASAPSSPRRAFARAGVEEAPLGEVRAAVPFVWELVPGKARSSDGAHGESSDDTEDGSSSSSNSVTTDSSSHPEFEFSSRFAGAVDPPLPPCRAAEELFSNGRLLPLRLPPRLQAVRNLRNASPDSGYNSHASFQSCLSPAQSPHVIAASPKEAGVQERQCSLSPLRIHTLDSNPPGNNLSPDSVSSASSSSERNADSPQNSPEEISPSSATLKDLLFTDLAMASMRAESMKRVTSPRLVQSKRELLKKQQEQWNGMADSDKDDEPATPIPPISRSNAKPRPSIDVEAKTSSQKESVGRAIFGNRFGMLCSCMGMAALPNSP